MSNTPKVKSNVATKINLSRIPIKELPRKTILCNFDGEEKEYWIRALDESKRMCIQSLWTGNDVLRPAKLYTLLLTAGLEAINEEQEIAQFLLENVTEEAKRVGNEIYAFTAEYYEKIAEEAEEARKNSPQSIQEEATEDTQV